jgi:hypothetical protein
VIFDDAHRARERRFLAGVEVAEQLVVSWNRG